MRKGFQIGSKIGLNLRSIDTMKIDNEPKWGIWKMKDYLEGYHLTGISVLTDQQLLKWLEKIDNPSRRLARRAIELGEWH